MTKKLVVILSLLILTSCSSGSEDLKSPCVGIEDSPCGPRKPVNNWLL